MTQLSLFDSVAPSVTSSTALTVMPPARRSVPTRRARQVVRPSVSFPSLLPETSEVRESQEALETAQPAVEKRRRSLRELAIAIHEGRQALRRTPESGVQRMGDLAQVVLERHDMVARRRQGRLPSGE